jgi:hypothetical protein
MVVAIDTTIYSLEYLQRREEWRDAYRVMATVFADAFGVGSIIDVGCAGGLLVEALRSLGFDAWGLDGAPASQSLWPDSTRHFYLLGDLTRPADIELPATSLVCSLEVAEHLPEACAAAYVQLLARHQPRYILFTAAPVGQRGDGHLNCQLFSYWLGLFAGCGYHLDVPVSCQVRHEFRAACGRAHVKFPKYYINNFLAFGRRHGTDGDRTRSLELVRHELAAQRELLEFLLQRCANITECITLLRRALGESTEPSAQDVMRLRFWA